MRIIGADCTNFRVKDLEMLRSDFIGTSWVWSRSASKSTVVVRAVGLIGCSCDHDESHD